MCSGNTNFFITILCTMCVCPSPGFFITCFIILAVRFAQQSGQGDQEWMVVLAIQNNTFDVLNNLANLMQIELLSLQFSNISLGKWNSETLVLLTLKHTIN